MGNELGPVHSTSAQTLQYTSRIQKTKNRPGLFFFFLALGLTAIAEAPDLLKVKYFTKQIEN